MTGGEFELRVVGTKDATGLSRWLRSFVRVALHAATEGWADKYAPVALQVVDRQTGECVAQTDFGRDLDGAEAARIGLADELAALTLDEFCATYHFDRCATASARVLGARRVTGRSSGRRPVERPRAPKM